MTVHEKKRLLTYEFNELWNKLWGDDIGIQYRNEEQISKDKFTTLKTGVMMNGEVLNLENLINESTDEWTEPEWGFPKGRRNYQERDYDCAIREWEEETGYSRNSIKIINSVLPYEEIFTGSNYKSYKHKYYLANIKNSLIDTCNYQKSEVSNMNWFSLEECKKKLRPYNFERIEIIEQVDKILHKYSLI